MFRGSPLLGVSVLLLTTCTPLRPEVTLEPGVSLKTYHLVAVGPVTDRSGFPFHYEVGDTLRSHFADELRKNGVRVVPVTTDTTVPVLFVVSSLDRFRSGALTPQLPSAMGTSQCVFSTRLLDGQSGRKLGEIVSSEIVDQEDTPVMTPQALLFTCVRLTADEIHRRIH